MRQTRMRPIRMRLSHSLRVPLTQGFIHVRVFFEPCREGRSYRLYAERICR
jgi:hypothetical protein